MLNSMVRKKLVKGLFGRHLPRNHRVNQNYSINQSIAIININQYYNVPFYEFSERMTCQNYQCTKLFILGIHVDFYTMSRCNFVNFAMLHVLMKNNSEILTVKLTLNSISFFYKICQPSINNIFFF